MPDDLIYDGPGAYDEVFPYDPPLSVSVLMRAKATMTEKSSKIDDATLDI
jgi:hypothetical protein